MTNPRTVLFVCRHGSAKSVLAATDFRTLAAERHLDVVAVAAGVEPDPDVAATLIDALPDQGLGGYVPRAVTAADLRSASRVITFNLDADDLPFSSSRLERWDDIPAVSDDFNAAREAIGRHLQELIDRFSDREIN
jgi:protein-tyrosine-phosphatase